MRYGLGLSGLGLLLLMGAMMSGAERVPEVSLEQANTLFQQGNYKEALDAYRKLALNAETPTANVIHSLNQAHTALRQLASDDEIDAFREQVAQVHAGNWAVLRAVALSYIRLTHYGFVVEGEFFRGNRRNRDGAEYVDATARDRVRALQLMQQALPLTAEASPKDRGEFLLDFARVVQFMRDSQHNSWELQSLTDLTTLPDYEAGRSSRFGRWGGHGGGTPGAPVDAAGDPLLYTVPAGWEQAENDGQRWRWLLEQAVAADESLTNQVRWTWGEFLWNNFGVQTMRDVIAPLLARQAEQAAEGEAALNEQTGPFALHTLKENETIAKLATGVKRFELPDEFHFIKVFQQIVAEPKTGYGEQALGQLAQIFENRQQYPRAAGYWRDSIAQYQDNNQKTKAQRLAQIVDPWGTFEGTQVQYAGNKATLDFRFRNGEELELQAYEVNYRQLLKDVQAFLKSNPQNWNGRQADLQNIGHRLVYENETKYLGPSVAQWTEKLEPRANHFDRRISLQTPLEKAGAYLLVAKMKNGNTSRVIVWLDDTALVRKTLNDAQWYYAADAKTGEPVPEARLDFFGYKIERPNARRYVTTVSQFVDKTDRNGQLAVGGKRLETGYNWLVTASTPAGRLAFLGFNGIWHQSRTWESHQQNRVFIVTDRPVYRPGQKVSFKVWVRRADYTSDKKSDFAGQKFPLVIEDPRSEKLLEQNFQADEYGGFSGEITLAEDATLGQYQISLPWRNDVGGGNSFLVEEYKKPEYEVTVDAPSEPVQLGDKITATVRAKYYFGAPVVNATVSYKIERTTHTDRWFPVEPWDWLYGRGYGWMGRGYDWYPGFARWGCLPPTPIWWHRAADPPELISQNEVPIGPDGTIEIEIDTALAKAIHGDKDHNYTITAEVVDQSRRTIVGVGSVLVAREPFQVHVWGNQGYYRVGDEITAQVKAQTIAQKPIVGNGELTLFAIAYDKNGKPSEKKIDSWPLNTNEQGAAEHKIRAPQAGQYRLSYRITSAAGDEREGAMIFLVRGDNSTLVDYRFDDLEVIPDRKTYQPGETVKLLINANRENAVVLLFLRPSNGVYLPPQTIRLNGKSTVVDIGIQQKDMPNFFVEAVTLANANLFEEVREILVPPEKRVINVSVEPSSERYLPGQEAEVTIKLTDLEGQPIIGSTVLTVYDRSVEYISGGSNVPEIRDFFWQFRRSHYPGSESSLQRYFSNLLKKGEISMQNLGVFGHLAADNMLEKAGRDKMQMEGGFGGGMDNRRFRGGEMDMIMESAAPMAAMAAGAPADAMIAAPQAKSDKSFLEQQMGGPALVEPTVRKDFADTAYWNALITPNAEGIAKVTFPMPENLTGWKLKAWSIGDGTRVGEGEAAVVTSKDVLVRLQAPRFFVQTDEVILSANVHNYLEAKKLAKVELILEGNTLEALDDAVRSVTIEPNGEVRVDWKVKAVAEGDAIVTIRALTDADSDAMQMTFPVYVHGMLKMESFTGVVRKSEAGGQFTLRVPSERRPEQSRLEVRYSPSLAGALVDALPYLVEYPYGCTEQTLNRFLPSVITQRVLQRMGVNLEELEKHRANLNAQELGDPAVRAAQWKRFDRNPVYDTALMEEIVKTNLKKLADMQLRDGGWGWFSGPREQSTPHTTATVVHGLQVAVKNGLLLPDGVLENGLAWLKKYQAEQVEELQRGEQKEPQRPYKTAADNVDALVHMILVDAEQPNPQMQEYLYRDRTKLSVYSLAMFGLSLHKLAANEQLEMVQRNISQYLVEDLENETAYLKLPAGYAWWYWHGNEIEANAYYLKLLSKTEPNGVQAPRLVKYLLNNRKHATYWSSTRDTALCIEAFADYLQASGEDQPNFELDLLVDGEVRKTVAITPQNLFTFDASFVLEGAALTAGEHTVEFRKRGSGPVYWNAYLTNFTLEDPIAATGLELKIRRNVYKLVERENATATVAGSRGQAVDQNVLKYDRVELHDFDPVVSGDLLEIELGIDSKNDYEYVILEDFKAAGNEPVDLQSGYREDGNGAYVEFRDEKVAFFFRQLPRGTSSMSYRLRAEIPGQFSALPAISYAMYAPELKANSDEFKTRILDRE